MMDKTPKQLWNCNSVQNLQMYLFSVQSYINILKVTRIWDGHSLKYWIERERKKKGFFPGNGKQFLIVSICKKKKQHFLLLDLLKSFLLYVFYLEDKLTFDFDVIIILCHLSKINVTDSPFLFSCTEEKLRNDKWLPRHLTKVCFLGFVLSREDLKLQAGEKDFWCKWLSTWLRSVGYISDKAKLNHFLFVHVFHIINWCMVDSLTKIQVIMDTKVSLIKWNCENYPD